MNADRVELRGSNRTISTAQLLVSDVLVLRAASLEDLVRLTGLSPGVIVEQMKEIKKTVGGIKGSAQKGYSLVKDPEKRLKLAQFTNI